MLLRCRPQAGDQDLVASLDDHAAVRGPDLPGPQRQQVHSGLVSEEMVGHKFGEFAPTRTYYGHAADKKAKRK
jgi:hypothetical protein